MGSSARPCCGESWARQAPDNPVLSLRSPYLALLAVTLQTAGILLIDPGFSDPLRRVLIVGGYALALAFVWRNRGLLPLQVLAAGLLLNLLPILANGGLMPVTYEDAVRAGLATELEDVKPGHAIPRSKDVLLARHDIHLAPLTDNVVLPSGLPGRGVASPGDLVIAAAVVLATGFGLSGLTKQAIAAGRLHLWPAQPESR